jgi:hypothetical protein
VKKVELTERESDLFNEAAAQFRLGNAQLEELVKSLRARGEKEAAVALHEETRTKTIGAWNAIWEWLKKIS